MPIFDSKRNNCTKQITSLGQGSQVSISYSYFPFYMSGNNYGVSLRLNALQLVKHVPIKSNGSKYGFEVVPNGFVAQALEDESEIPY